MSTPEPQIDPKAPAKALIVTKAFAATSQVEAAISLWFQYGDPVSICTLAYAAQDCYAAMSGHIDKPSLFKIWFESQSKTFRKRIRFILSFFKHGAKKLKGRVTLPTVLGEILIADSIQCHQYLFGRETPLMSFFMTRFGLENPLISNAENLAALRKQLHVYDLVDVDRTEFLNKATERIVRLVALKIMEDQAGSGS